MQQSRFDSFGSSDFSTGKAFITPPRPLPDVIEARFMPRFGLAVFFLGLLARPQCVVGFPRGRDVSCAARCASIDFLRFCVRVAAGMRNECEIFALYDNHRADYFSSRFCFEIPAA